MTERQENMFTRQSTGDAYLAFRPKYPSKLFEEIIEFHANGSRKTRELAVIDMGCGPGIATSAISKHAKSVVGVDPSESMIETAKRAETQENVSYVVGFADQLQGIAQDQSIDIAISATAAHWFPKEQWYKEMARVLRPDGVIAVFTYSWQVPVVDSEKQDKVYKLVKDYAEILKQKTYQEGNALVDSLYTEFPPPSTFPSVADQFERQTTYKVWNKDLKPDKDGKFFMLQSIRWSEFEPFLGTAGPLVKWQEMNKEEADAYVKSFKQKLADLGGFKDEDEVQWARPLALVMWRRK